MAKKKQVKPEKSEEIENLKNQLKRTLADYQNLERRVALLHDKLRNAKVEKRKQKIKLAKKISKAERKIKEHLDAEYKRKLEEQVHSKEEGMRQALKSELKRRLNDYIVKQQREMERKRHVLQNEIKQRAEELLG